LGATAFSERWSDPTRHRARSGRTADGCRLLEEGARGDADGQEDHHDPPGCRPVGMAAEPKGLSNTNQCGAPDLHGGTWDRQRTELTRILWRFRTTADTSRPAPANGMRQCPSTRARLLRSRPGGWLRVAAVGGAGPVGAKPSKGFSPTPPLPTLPASLQYLRRQTAGESSVSLRFGRLHFPFFRLAPVLAVFRFSGCAL